MSSEEYVNRKCVIIVVKCCYSFSLHCFHRNALTLREVCGKLVTYHSELFNVFEM